MSKVFEAIEKLRLERDLVQDNDFLAQPSPPATEPPRPPALVDRVTAPPSETPSVPGHWTGAVERRLRLPEEHLVSLLSPTSFEAEQYRKLRHIVERMHKEQRLSVVAVTSPTVGDGKTTTAINLAGSLAQARGARVLLVDADLRQPTVTAKLGMRHPPICGLVEAIEGRVSLFDAVRFLREFNLAVLPSGRPPASPYELLESVRLHEIMEEARQLYDYIVLDTPPAVAYPDCAVLESQVDGFLLVVTAHRTPRKLLDDAIQELAADKILGLVFNGLGDRAGYYQSAHDRPNGKRGRRASVRGSSV